MDTRPAPIREADPKGLIRESYRIDGITVEECRSIFLDWALSVPGDASETPLVRRLLAHHGQIEPLHPMTAVLKAALAPPPRPVRRGGRSGRLSS